jgi:LPXTG-motif cell wall-anchored protein
VFSFDFTLIKTNELEERLDGAKFRLYRDNGGFTWNAETNTAANGTLISFEEITANARYMHNATGGVTEFVTDTNGSILLEGLAEGIYYLVEIEAPKDYNKLPTPIKVEIIYAVIGYTSNLLEFTSQARIEQEGELCDVVEIENRKGLIFPETGGITTAIFYIVGSMLTLGAGTFLIVRIKMASLKKRREEEAEIENQASMIG